MEFYLTIKKNEIPSFSETWMELEMLSNISQTKNDKYVMLLSYAKLRFKNKGMAVQRVCVRRGLCEEGTGANRNDGGQERERVWRRGSKLRTWQTSVEMSYLFPALYDGCLLNIKGEAQRRDEMTGH